jgi:hypothetical protein
MRVTSWKSRVPESVADLLQRLNAAPGKVARENIVIDEVLAEIKRRR